MKVLNLDDLKESSFVMLPILTYWFASVGEVRLFLGSLLGKIAAGQI